MAKQAIWRSPGISKVNITPHKQACISHIRVKFCFLFAYYTQKPNHKFPDGKAYLQNVINMDILIKHFLIASVIWSQDVRQNSCSGNNNNKKGVENLRRINILVKILNNKNKRNKRI